MAKKQVIVRQDASITSVQKMITLCMLAFMGYLFFMQDRHIQQTGQNLPEAVKEVAPLQTIAPEPIKVRITDTDSGDISFSDLRKGKVLIGKWEIELDTPKAEPYFESDNPKAPEEVQDNLEVQFEPTPKDAVATAPKPDKKEEPAKAVKKVAPKVPEKSIEKILETPVEKPTVKIIEKK